ncbi:LuxR C-terminal-related transcriptional regulator [Streptomyces bobili]|uniref:helix-turn-helix transcriptional regulator n=1 Tax=Streptomyces bobili TaxID=67280 RepID=UPI003F53E94B
MSMRTPVDVTTSVRDARTLRPLPLPPWPFTGRDEELQLLRGSLGAGRRGIVVTGPAGCGRSRLAAEAVRGTDCVRVAGTPETRRTAFAAFAHLLPEGVTLHRAVQLLTGVRLLLVDDAHLLDGDSAALVHQLAVHGRTRLLILATDGAPAPGAVARLSSGDLLPRLALEPLPREDITPLLATAAGVPLEPLTVNRLHALSRGDLGLLRDLLDALLRGQGVLSRDPEGEEWRWRGPVPVTPALRERAAAALARTCPEEREILDRLAFAEPLPLGVEGLDLGVLERLEADGLVHADDDATVRLARPLYGSLLRAVAGRLRARRLTGGRRAWGAALETEAGELVRRIDGADVRDGTAPVGEWLVGEGEVVPAGYAGVRARFARLRGELREAVAWAREGLAGAPRDEVCLWELGCSAAQLGDLAPAAPSRPDPGGCRPQHSAPGPERYSSSNSPGGSAPGRAEHSRASASSAGRAGNSQPSRVTGRAPSSDAGRADVPRPSLSIPPSRDGGPPARARPRVGASGHRSGGPGGGAPWAGEEGVPPGMPDEVGPHGAARQPAPGGGVFARHADALARRDAPGLDAAAAELAERGFILIAAEAHAQAASLHRDPRAARTARTRAVALARRCQGARTPALAGLVLGELTTRQRQIVTLAASGLSNRQIAERLTLSVRTVGNHLYGAYTRLGASDRAALPWLVELPDTRTA